MAMKTPFRFREPGVGRLRSWGPAVGPRRRKSFQASAIPSGVRQRRAFAVEEGRGVGASWSISTRRTYSFRPGGPGTAEESCDQSHGVAQAP